jgi:hypothetical protein
MTLAVFIPASCWIADRFGMLMRERLNALLEAHGERAVPR